MRKPYNTIIDKEAMYDIMARLSYENDVESILKDDVIIVKAFDKYYNKMMTYRLVVFKDRISHRYPLEVYWIDNNRSFRVASIDTFLDWLAE